MIAIEINQAQLAEVQHLLSDIKNGADRALSMALNKTAAKAKTETSRAIRAQVRLPAAYVGARLEVVKAAPSRLLARLRTPHHGILLSYFLWGAGGAQARYSRASGQFVVAVSAGEPRVKVKPSGAAKRVRGGFLVRLPNRTIAIARAKNPNDKRWGRPIEVLYGPSLSQVFKRDTADRMAAEMSAYLAAQLDQAAHYLLTQQAARIDPNG